VSKHPVAVTLNTIMDEMSVKYLERRSTILAMVLTVLAKQHIFLVGPPGTGKSAMVRDLVDRIVTASYFECLLSRQRPDAAILGPYNLPELRDKGDFHRKVAGFLPTANFAFLDEIGKMGSTLGHDLLSILNERLYHEVNGGRSAKPVPLYTAFTAANEFLTDDNDDAAALWDRLLVRDSVDYLGESSSFAALLTLDTSNIIDTTIDFADLVDVIDNVVPNVRLTQDAVDMLVRLRQELRSAEVIPSDRRWKQSVRVLQANAFLNGRTEVNEDDIYALRYTLWDTLVQKDAVERLTLSVSNPEAEKVLKFVDDLATIAHGITERRGQSVEARAQYGTEVNGKVKLIASELGKLRQDALAAGRSVAKVDEAIDQMNTVKTSIYVDLLDMDPSMVGARR
jgi:MoxR-like ATPase